MEDWKVRQEIYHRTNPNHVDDLSQFEIEMTEDVVKHAVDYFVSRDKGWVYPSKSYMVAICYARWLAESFGGTPEQYLDDPELLYGNDPYFVEYSRDPKTYHQILKEITWQFDETKGMCPDVKGYFKEEFML